MTFDKSAKIPKKVLRRIQVLNKQRRFRICRDSVTSFCEEILRSLDLPDRGLSVVFVGAREMREVNGAYRGKDYATDVLSFSYEGVVVEEVSFLGEIVIAPEVAANHAIRYGTTPERELRRLLVHGTLHLLGYDHETDKGQMNRLQGNIWRRKFFLSSPPLLEP
jgi:probable rRNA maturation factor